MKLIIALLNDLEHLLDCIFQKPKAEEEARRFRLQPWATGETKQKKPKRKK
jgi:hypothetical protein